MGSLSPADLRQIRKRRKVIVAIQLILALGFIFRPASYLPREGYIFYHSYYADVMIPFGFYFLLGVNDKTIAWSKSLCKLRVRLSTLAFKNKGNPLYMTDREN